MVLANEIAVSIEKIKQQADDYVQTVLALLAFANHACWDETKRELLVDSRFTFGKRMINQSGTEVTPDLIVQRTKNYGLVAEVRKDLPKEESYWLKEFSQLESYDGKLDGWFTTNKKIDTADIVLLTHYTRGPAAARFLEKKIGDGSLSFSNKISIVTFVFSAEVKEFIALEKKWGKISLQELERSLESVRSVSIEKLNSTYGYVKFYDAEPPLPYLLVILWDQVFNPLKEKFKYDEGRKSTPIQVSIDELRNHLQVYFGPPKQENHEREPEIPKREWVKKALEILCTVGMAERDNLQLEKYTILFKKKKQDTFQMFAKICCRMEVRLKKGRGLKQLKIQF